MVVSYGAVRCGFTMVGMNANDDAATIARFVLRARRIEAHSLVRDWDELIRHAEGSVSVRIGVDGAVSVTRTLPEDEEAFESLAARVRPLTLDSEPIHHAKVVGALERLLAGAAALDEHHREGLRKLRVAWQAAELQGVQVQGYSVQSVRLDGSGGTPMVSDTQLAAGWLYADLVHADAKGPKKDALLFPLRERYAAAVRVFARVATLAVSTLRLVETLRDAGAITVPKDAWEDEVAVGTTKHVEQAELFIAPAGTDAPDLRDSNLGLGDEWERFTVTELLRQDPANHVHVGLARADGSVVADYAAAVARRQLDGDLLRWQVLIAGCVLVSIEFAIQGEKLASVSQARLAEFDSTNELILASRRLRLEMHEAARMTFDVGGTSLVTFALANLDDEELAETRVLAETVADIAAIEAMSGETSEPCTGEYNDLDRVKLRQARLILEGHIVGSFGKPIITTVIQGTPPQAVAVEPGTVDVGGARLPAPGMVLRHPAMTCRDLGPAPDSGPDARKFEVVPPAGQRLLAWSLHLRQIALDEELQATASWNLTGIDEATFPI